MTFKEETYKELVNSLKLKNCCKAAFLSALSKITGTMEIKTKRLNLCLHLDDYESALKVAEIFKDLYPIDVELTINKSRINARTGEPTIDLMIPSGFTKQVVEDFELMTTNGDEYESFIEGIPQDLIRNECCKIAYFKGLYLGCGSVYIPSSISSDDKKEGYHFELSLSDDLMCDDVMELLSDLRINTKMSERGENKLLYIKDKHEVLEALLRLDLVESAMKLKTIIDERETANALNRAVICETANLDKTYAAASKQILAIGKLKNMDTFDTLPQAIKDTADARTKYSEASLQELADILGITKSCLNHRLRKIVELANAEGE